MKQTLHRIYTVRNLAKAFEWARLLSITSLAQIIIQAIGLTCGILVIRLLSVEEYAIYTLANTMLGTLTVLADGGLYTGIMAQGGKVWSERGKLGVVLATGVDLRKKFAIGSLLLATPVLLFLLQHHGVSWIMSFFILVAIIPAFLSSLMGSLFEVAPKLHQDIKILQKNQVEANLGRLLLIVASIFVFPWAFVAVFASGLPQMWANLKLHRISSRYVDWNQKPDPVVRNKILVFVKLLLPGAIYYCISGQITVWLISLYGSTTAVAQIGALGRLGMLLSIFSLIINVIVIPRFARLPEKKHILFTWYVYVLFSVSLLSMIVLGLIWCFSSQLLWILGNGYTDLEGELLLFITGGCLNQLVGVCFALNTTRGWLMNPVLGILIGVAGIFFGILVIDVSTLQGILLYNIFTGIVGLFIHPLYGIIKIFKMHRN